MSQAHTKTTLSIEMHDRRAMGRESDSTTGYGPFETAVYRVHVTVAGRGSEARFGNLPPAQGIMLSMGRTDDILGYGFFNRFRVSFSAK